MLSVEMPLMLLLLFLWPMAHFFDELSIESLNRFRYTLSPVVMMLVHVRCLVGCMFDETIGYTDFE